MSDSSFLRVDSDFESNLSRDDFEPSQKEIKTLRTIYEEKRKNKHENAKHIIAAFVIIPYIFLLSFGCLWNFEVPRAYETLALIVIGYYFAKQF